MEYGSVWSNRRRIIINYLRSDDLVMDAQKWKEQCVLDFYLCLFNISISRSWNSSECDWLQLSLKNRPEIPTGWTCKPEQYGSGDGCQCNCGAFDPDCDSFEAVSINCPNNDDICIPSPLNEPVCALRHEVLSDRKLIQIQSGVAVHHPQFYFSNETDIDGAPWGNYTKTYTRSEVPTTWTCNPLLWVQRWM